MSSPRKSCAMRGAHVGRHQRANSTSVWMHCYRPRRLPIASNHLEITGYLASGDAR